MLDWLLNLDRDVFLYLNGIHSPSWDSFMWWVSRTNSWIPLYIILLIVVIYRERPFRFVYTLVFIALVVLLDDQISVLIKNLVQRPRPTHNLEIAGLVHIVNDYKGGQYGFVSSHAANVFGIATFLANQFKGYKWGIFLFAWAALVSYSRIYLGVHYPLDIIFGAILGVLIGVQCYVFKVRTAVYIGRQIDIREEKKIEKLKKQKANADAENKNREVG